MRTPAKITRRAALAATFSFGLPAGAIAQADWPRRPLRIIIPFAPGASNDLIARAAANGLQPLLGVAVAAENRPGAGGSIGSAAVAQAPPDGYTLMIASTSLTISAAVQTVPYDPVRDFQPLRLLAQSPIAVAVPGNSPYRTLGELVAAARARPGSIRYGSAGPGGLNHLAGATFALRAGVEMEHIPYRGMSLAVTDLIGNRIEAVFPSLPGVLGQARGGQVRILGVLAGERHADLPDVPTAREAGFDVELFVWWGILGPRGMPRAVVERLDQALLQVLDTPEMKRFLAAEGATPANMGADEFQRLIEAETTRFAEVVRAAGISAR